MKNATPRKNTARKAKVVRRRSVLPPPCEKPATDVYTFENLRKRGYTYVDKTATLLPLLDESVGNQFFIARPRRFGKSLCISTLQAIFEGKEKLFKGLAIENQWDWKKNGPCCISTSAAARRRRWRLCGKNLTAF